VRGGLEEEEREAGSDRRIGVANPIAVGGGGGEGEGREAGQRTG
jgi:hypothetical protein